MQVVVDTIPFFESYSAPETGHVGNLSSRTDVWSTVTAAAGPMETPDFLLGHGAFGQIPSGISRETAYLFDFLEDPEVAGAHNSVLQQFIDQGIVGAGLLIAVVAGGATGAHHLLAQLNRTVSKGSPPLSQRSFWRSQ